MDHCTVMARVHVVVEVGQGIVKLRKVGSGVGSPLRFTYDLLFGPSIPQAPWRIDLSIFVEISQLAALSTA